jgi:hypothetical protein
MGGEDTGNDVATALKAWEEHKEAIEREEAQETPG